MGTLLLFVTLPFFISVLIAALIKPVQKLNVNALSSVTLLALSGHHHFEKIFFRLFIVCPDLTPAVAYGRDLA